MNALRMALVTATCLLPLVSLADVMIITHDHVAISAKSARKNGTQIVYKDAASGAEHAISTNTVDAIIPRVERSRSYDDAYITKVLDRIHSLRTRHGTLLRQINEVRQEWEALQKPAAKLDDQIVSIEQGFRTSQKDTTAYKQAVMSLSMLQYKDVRGTYRERIDGILSTIRKDYVDLNTGTLKALGNASYIGIDDFRKIDALGIELSDASLEAERPALTALRDAIRQRVFTLQTDKARSSFEAAGMTLDAARTSIAMLMQTAEVVAATPEQKSSAAALQTTIREQTIDANAAKAVAAFDAAPSLDTYLATLGVLIPLRAEVAVTDDLKSRADAFMDSLRTKASGALPDYNFSYKGFPLTTNDTACMEANEATISSQAVPKLPVDEQCLILPLEPVPPITSAPQMQPIRLIFNRQQPANREFAVFIVALGRGDDASTARILPKLDMKDGRINMRLPVDLGFLPSGFAPKVDASGVFSVYVYVAARDMLEGMILTPWRPISLACRWPAK